MNFCSIFRPFGVYLASLGLFFTGSQASFANNSELQLVPKTTTNLASSFSNNDFEYIRQELEHAGVSTYVTNQLIQKLKQGEIWESLKPGAKPVSSVKNRLNNKIKTIDTYKDGSITIRMEPSFDTTDSELKSDKYLRDVHDCKYTSGGNYAGYWKDCTAEVNTIVMSMGFIFDYEAVQTKGAKITGYRSYFHHVVGAQLGNFRIERMSDTQVRLSADLQAKFIEIPIGFTKWMQANVDISKAWTTNN